MNEKLLKILENENFSTYKRILAGDTLRSLYAREDETWVDAEAIALRVIELGTPFAADKAADYDERLEVNDCLERAYITRARNDFHSFLMVTEWHTNVKERFYYPRMEVLRPIVNDLTDMMVRDKYDVYMLSCPPRTGKTRMAHLFVSWCMGRNPEASKAACSYGSSITREFYEAVRDILTNPVYNFNAVFPLCRVTETTALEHRIDVRADGKDNHRMYPTLICRSIGGAMTGAVEAEDLLYCDDLVKELSEVLNSDVMLKNNQEFRANVYSRMKEGCKQLFIGTRWSINDIMGEVERDNRDDPRCKVVAIPAIDEETGLSNFEYKFNVGFTAEGFRKKTLGMDEVTYQCMYMQRPIEREGLLFHESEMKLTHTAYTAEYLEKNPPDDIFTWVDVAFGGLDYVSAPICYQWGDDAVIVDWVFVRGDYSKTEPIVAERLIRHKVRHATFEANNGGEFYAKDVAQIIKDTSEHVINITSLRAEGNKAKESRIIQHQAKIRELFYLAKGLRSAEYEQAFTNLVTYSQGSNNTNDDAPDSLAGLSRLFRKKQPTVEVFDRRYI